MAAGDYCSSIAIKELSADVFRNLPAAQRFALDIGGSLSKIAYQSKRKWRETFVIETEADTPMYSTRDLEKEEDCLHFVKFETRLLESCLEFVRANLGDSGGLGTARVTGGGAYKHRELIEQKLGCQVEKEDEMTCLVRGCSFVLRNIPGELFSYDRDSSPPYSFADGADAGLYPFLLVNIGSGVSLLKVDSENEYSRVGGTSIGGGTFWGIGSLLAGTSDFDELLEVASRGDHRSVDMLVGDIYGFDADSPTGVHGLSADIIASSFGKASRSDGASFSKPDRLRSLLITISNNIGQLAYLYARRHRLQRVLFAGFYIRGHQLTMRTLSYAVKFWSQGSINAHFLRHEGYLGAIGAFVCGLEKDSRTGVLSAAWAENLCTSSKFPADSSRWQSLAALELDRSKHLSHFPLLLDRHRYAPDTWDLGQDLAARRYWLDCFEKSIGRHEKQAADSQVGSPGVERRAVAFRSLYANFFREARANPLAIGQLSVRRILDVQEHCLRECGFPDPYCEQKKSENEAALSGLAARLEALNALDGKQRAIAALTGVLAGNVFDWGAGHVAQLLAAGDFGLREAEGHLQRRPWLVDDADAWAERLLSGANRCAMIFVDNSGFDLLLGVVPFAVDLLQRGLKVILVANHGPALNDVTIYELRALLRRVAEFVPPVAEALACERLLLLGSGSSSPCLDLRRVSAEVVDACDRYGVDLVVIEGMGRAVHTNLYARFTCDCLRLAVLKNAWLAERLGGQLFSVICSFAHAGGGGAAQCG